MKFLPRTPLDSSSLGRGTEREVAVILRKVMRSQSCSLKKSREEDGAKGERGRQQSRQEEEEAEKGKQK
jgi:hypothetical protein